jgi:hypothetical protein
MGLWRAGCSETGTSGSEGGPGKRTRTKAWHRAPARPTTQSEDASQVRTGHAPQNLAALRNLVINLFRLDGQDNIAAAHRHYADQPHLIGPTLTAV